MSIYSPTVLPTSGRSLAQALGQGVNSYLQTRRQRMEDEADLYGHGLMAAPEGTQAPTAPTQGQTNAAIAAGVKPLAAGVLPQGMTPTPTSTNGLPAIQQTPSAASVPSVHPEQLAAALGASPSQSDPYSMPVHLYGRDWVMTPQARAQMVMARALQQAEIGQKYSEAHKNLREADELRPGDQGYDESKGRQAGLEAMAKLPAAIAEARARGQIERANLLAGIQARGDIEGALQASQQGFLQAQQGREQTFQAGQQRERIAGEGQNQINLQGVKEGGEFTPGIVRRIRGNPLPPFRQPGTSVAPTSPTGDDPFADLHPKTP